MSHTIKRLENRLGFKLLKRQSDGFVLTKEAKSFHEYANRLVKKMGQVDEAVRQEGL